MLRELKRDMQLRIAALLPSRALARLGSASQDFGAGLVRDAATLAARQAGRAVPSAPSEGRARLEREGCHSIAVKTWAQWHDADDDLWNQDNSWSNSDADPRDSLSGVYRLVAFCPDAVAEQLQTPDERHQGVSLIVLPCGAAWIIVSSSRMPDGEIRTASVPGYLRCSHLSSGGQGAMSGRSHTSTQERTESLMEFAVPQQRNVDLIGPHADANACWCQSEALSIIRDVFPDVLEPRFNQDADAAEGPCDSGLALDPVSDGLRFHFGASSGEPGSKGYDRSAQYTQQGDIQLRCRPMTPLHLQSGPTNGARQKPCRCLLRPTHVEGFEVNSATVKSVCLGEAALWSERLAVRPRQRDAIGCMPVYGLGSGQGGFGDWRDGLGL